MRSFVSDASSLEDEHRAEQSREDEHQKRKKNISSRQNMNRNLIVVVCCRRSSYGYDIVYALARMSMNLSMAKRLKREKQNVFVKICVFCILQSTYSSGRSLMVEYASLHFISE